MNKYILGSCVLLSVVSCAWSYGSGAPSAVCDDMIPKHHVDPQTTAFPYLVKLNKKSISPGEKVAVTIAARPNEEFKGFLIEARVGNVPVGKFSAGAGYKLVDCAPGKANAATHKDADAKTSIQLQWIAPPGLTETVQFYTTVAKNGGEFWVKQPSGRLTIKKA